MTDQIIPHIKDTSEVSVSEHLPTNQFFDQITPVCFLGEGDEVTLSLRVSEDEKTEFLTQDNAIILLIQKVKMLSKRVENLENQLTPYLKGYKETKMKLAEDVAEPEKIPTVDKFSSKELEQSSETVRVVEDLELEGEQMEAPENTAASLNPTIREVSKDQNLAMMLGAELIESFPVKELEK